MSAVAENVRPWERPKASPQSNAASAIDELGLTREQMKTLETREKELVALVKEMGDGEHLGTKCKAVVSVSSTNRLDATALKTALPEEMIAKFTVSSPTVRVTIKPLL